MSDAEKSQPSEISIADAAERISLMESREAQAESEGNEVADAEVEQTEAALEEDYETSDSEEEALVDDDGFEEDGESEDGADESEEPEKPIDLDQLVTVKINGKTEKITLKEATEGYQRQSDYSRNLNLLRQEKQALDQERDQINQVLSIAMQNMQESEIPEPDWDALYEEDPIAFPKVEKQWRDYQAARQQQFAEMQMQQQQIQAAQQQQELENRKLLLVEGEKYLASQLKEWSDPESKAAATKKLREFGKKTGFSDAELSQVYDPRYIVILEKARRYDELQSNAPKPKKQAGPRPMKGGSSAGTPKRSDQLTRMQQRLKSSGHVNDAAALFSLLDSRRR